MQNSLIAQLTNNGEAVAKDLAVSLNLPKAEVAKALGELFKAGVIKRDLREKKLYYTMAEATAPAQEPAPVAPTEEVKVVSQGEVTVTSEDLVGANPTEAEKRAPEQAAADKVVADAAAEVAKAAPVETQAAKEEGAKVVPITPAPAKGKKTTKATSQKGKRKVVKEKAPKAPTAASLVAKIKKAKTEAEVKKIAGDDKRSSVIAAGVKQIAKLNAPAPKPKAKKAKDNKNKIAPAKEFINEDGTLDYAKLSKPKRGDLVEFEAWGENPAVTGIVLFPDWDFWQGKVYVKVLAANGKAGWKSVSKVTKVLAKKAAKTFIEGNKLKEAFEKAKAPAWREWKVELCKKALAAK